MTLSYIPSATVVPVIKVSHTDSLAHALTKMELNNFSQLPVVRGKSDRPTGVVTWEKIGRTLSSNPEATLQDCTDFSPPMFGLYDDLLPAIDTVNDCGYALVTTATGELSGIVTSADLGATLAQIAGPFLLLERLEDRLRHILDQLHRHGHINESRLAKSTSDPKRGKRIDAIDLTLGEKIDIVTSESTWKHVTSIFDRKAIAAGLEGAASLRNQLMHFRELNDTQERSRANLSHLVDTIVRIADSMSTGFENGPPDQARTESTEA